MANQLYLNILILIAGTLTIYSDIREKKIKNIHLITLQLLAWGYYFILFTRGVAIFTVSFFSNLLFSILLGFIFFAAGLWKAGDAKLFFTYSLLLPGNKYDSLFPFSCILLFFNAFIISFLFYFPLYFKNIASIKETIISHFVSGKIFVFLSRALLITFCISWLLLPLLNLLNLKGNIFLMFILLYGGYTFLFRFIGVFRNKLFVALIFAIGLLLRFILMPQSFYLTNIINYLKSLITYSLIFYFLRIIVDADEKKNQRVSFAPLLFLGAILSNTNFLNYAIKTLISLK